jgi:hypothetical protein
MATIQPLGGELSSGMRIDHVGDVGGLLDDQVTLDPRETAAPGGQQPRVEADRFSA